jgi:hypothetical protein
MHKKEYEEVLARNISSGTELVHQQVFESVTKEKSASLSLAIKKKDSPVSRLANKPPKKI